MLIISNGEIYMIGWLRQSEIQQWLLFVNHFRKEHYLRLWTLHKCSLLLNVNNLLADVKFTDAKKKKV